MRLRGGLGVPVHLVGGGHVAGKHLGQMVYILLVVADGSLHGVHLHDSLLINLVIFLGGISRDVHPQRGERNDDRGQQDEDKRCQNDENHHLLNGDFLDDKTLLMGLLIREDQPVTSLPFAHNDAPKLLNFLKFAHPRFFIGRKNTKKKRSFLHQFTD